MSTLIVQVWTHAGVKCLLLLQRVYKLPASHTASLLRYNYCCYKLRKNVCIRKQKTTLSHVGEMTVNSHFPAKVVSLREPTHFL